MAVLANDRWRHATCCIRMIAPLLQASPRLLLALLIWLPDTNSMQHLPTFPLALLAAGFLVSSTSGQALAGAGPEGLAPYEYSGHYRLIAATGQIVPEPAGGGQNSTLDCGDFIVNAFVNLDASSAYIDGLARGASAGELVDWGVITREATSDIVTEFTFGYGTFDPDPSVGGIGAYVSINFYEGYQGPCAEGDPVVVDEVASFTFTGLPGHDGTTQGAQGFFITVDLRGGLEFQLPEGPFGFGTRYPGIGSVFTSTGLIQSLAGSPLGDSVNPDANGQVTALDYFQPDAATGICIGQLDGGYDATTQLPVGSHYLLLRKVNAEAAAPAASFVRNDSGNQNPIALLAGGTPILGQDFTLLAAATGPAEQGVFLAGFASPAEIATPFGVLLVDVTDPGGDPLASAGLTGPHAFAAGFVAIETPLPPNVELCGQDLFVQAMQFGSKLQLTNAVDLTFGVY